jgi:signal transduction histidine kinase
MIRLLREETGQALSEGYSALRVTGEMSWALKGLPGSEKIIEYEAKLNDFFPGSNCLAICQYDRRRFGPEVLLDVLTTHPIAVVGTEFYENFYYIPPHEYLGNKLPESTLDHWIANLSTRKKMEEALEMINRELEGYAHVVSHDLRGPISVIQSASATLDELIERCRDHEAADQAKEVAAIITHIYQLFSNLVGNALQYNDSPEPELRITYHREGDGRHRYRVADNGPGIPAEDLERIFDPLFKGKGGGTGIGLSIARKIASIYGGGIKAYDDGGARFEFTLRDA